MNYFRSCLLLLSLISIATEGRCATQRDFQTWLNLLVTGNFSKESKAFKRFKYWLEGQERLGDDSSRLSQTISRTALGYDLTKKASLWVGYAWIKTGLPFTTKPFIENRSWEQFLWTNKTKRWTFSSRTRMEQRFTKNRKVAYRARQQIKLSIPFKNHPKLSFVSSEELFWHKNNYIGKNGKGFDQNRFFIGLGYKVNSKITTIMDI